MKTAEELAAFWPKQLNPSPAVKADFIRFIQSDALPTIERTDIGKACDYCGKPMKLWVGIKRTCFDEACRQRAKDEQKDGPLVTAPQMMRMIAEEEHRRA